jgi:glycosyltransferase involved in cell wall biosynthesis
MRILFLHSGQELTGAITYCRALETAWAGEHEAFWAADRLWAASERSLVLPLEEKSLWKALQHASTVAAFVRQERISLLHSHSRRANIVAAWAARLAGVPYVVTAHMRTAARLANRLLPCWGDRTIAICDTIAEHLIAVNRVPRERVALIRNGIDQASFPPRQVVPRDPVITVLGRLSGIRWRAAAFIFDLLPELLARYPRLRVRFVGTIAAEHAQDVAERLSALRRAGEPPRVEAVGNVADVRPWIAESTLVIGAGRSLMEALSMEVPVVAVGERTASGLMSPDTYEAARASNFGDFSITRGSSFDRALTLDGITRVLEGRVDPSLGPWGRMQIARDFSLHAVASAVTSLYQAAHDARRARS